jgi:hypothetical protein
LAFSQPYELDMATVARMVAWCRRRGLTFKISGGSWHFPGATVLVEFSRASKDNRRTVLAR